MAGELVAAETWRSAVLVGVLRGILRDAKKWVVGDPDEVTRLEVCDTS